MTKLTVGTRVGPDEKEKMDNVWKKSNHCIAKQALRWTNEVTEEGADRRTLLEKYTCRYGARNMDSRFWFQLTEDRGDSTRHIGW